jgi:transketolase
MEKREMQRIMEMLAIIEAKMDADEEEMEADIKAWREEMAAWREKIAAETEVIKARTRAMRENMGTSHKEMVAEIKPEMDAETMACREYFGKIFSVLRPLHVVISNF